MTPSARLLLAPTAVAATLALAACGSDSSSSSSSTAAAPATSTPTTAALPGTGKPMVLMGDKNFTEQYILGQLYKQALEAKGYKVKLTDNIGSSEITDKALTSGKINVYPEYTGTIVNELAHEDGMPKTADATYAAAAAFETKRGFTMLTKTPFFDADGLAVTPAFAQKYGLKAIGDLSKAGAFKYGGPPESKTRYQGVVGLKKVYGLSKLQFKPLTIGLQYTALDKGKVDAADVFTTDGQLEGGKYTVLEDTKGIFGFQNVAPVVSTKTLSAEGPEFTTIMNAVSALLTNEAMQKMNAAVDLDKQQPADVAKAFLTANKLV